MTIAIIVGAVIVGLIGLLWLSEIASARKRFLEACSFESNGDFMRACYYFAVAGDIGWRQGTCRLKVISLWREHGPFDFKPVLDEWTDPDSPSCAAAGHALTMESMKRTLSRAGIDMQP